MTTTDENDEQEDEVTTELSPVRDLTPESHDSPAPEEEPETFPRAYVEELRQENGKYRQKAADRDEIAQRLHTALVTATGRLADPTDLPFDETHLADPDGLTAAIDALIKAKPHLASRKPRGSIGQGPSGAGDTVNLAGMLQARA